MPATRAPAQARGKPQIAAIATAPESWSNDAATARWTPFIMSHDLRLLIQIPCLNEHEQLPATLAALPRELPGISEIAVLVIDDGSTDSTVEVARARGVHYLIELPRRRGLAVAHMAGLDAGLRLGYDVVINTDADNQYVAQDMARLLAPILEKKANLVIGDRNPQEIASFSLIKRVLQRWGTNVVRRASGITVADSTSGFRAFDRRALQTIFIHNSFTYTLESIIQAGAAGLTVANVEVRTNAPTRQSRLFRSIPQYVRRSAIVILRAYSMYWPLQFFGVVAAGLFGVGSVLGGRFLYYYLRDPNTSSHIQSLQIGVGAIVMAFVVALMAQLGDLLAANRRLHEETLYRLRRLDAANCVAALARGEMPEGIERTSNPFWLAATFAPAQDLLDD